MTKKTPQKKTSKSKATTKTKPKTPSQSTRPKTSRQETIKELKHQAEKRLVELTEANRQLKRKIFDLYTIFELSRNFNAVLNFQTLLDSFVLTSLGQMGAARAALFLPTEADQGMFWLARVKGPAPLPGHDVSLNPNSECGKYITALNRPVDIGELRDKFPTLEDLGFIGAFRDGLVVPLVFQATLRGVLVIAGKESGQRYQADDIEFLSILASQTAVSIENARLYESEREALEKLQKTQKMLVQSERLAALGELSAKIAHEVNNPLGIIKNYLHLTSRVTGEDERVQEYVEIIKQEIDRIASIVRQLLDFHRPRAVQLARVDLTKVVKEVLSLMARQLADANVTTELVVQDDFPKIMAWADGLKQVFLNLLINARDVMKDGGTIKIGMTADSQLVRMCFEDSGPGIEAENIPHIFEPFFTTKAAGSGTGLGLSVCYGIVSNHGGSIRFRNLEKGGCFEVELPIEQKDIEYDWGI